MMGVWRVIDALETLADAVAEAVADFAPTHSYTLERLGQAGWHPVPGEIPGLSNAMAEASGQSFAINAAYRVVSPKGRVMAVYSRGDLVEIPLVIP